MKSTFTLLINGSEKTVVSEPQRPLLDVLREDLKLTGAKYGCGEGQCRCCLVLLDGNPVTSCITPVGAVHQKSITTIEGIAKEATFHPVQQAFLEEGAMQCGYCISGMILATVALLRKNPRPSEDQIIEALNGNICRCGVYPKILNAVRRAAGQTTEAKIK